MVEPLLEPSERRRQGHEHRRQGVGAALDRDEGRKTMAIQSPRRPRQTCPRLSSGK